MLGRIGIIVVLACLAAPASAELTLTPHSAVYKLKISVLGGELKTSLKATPTGYEATHVVRPTGISSLFASGSIAETSRFDSAPDGVKPTHYKSSDTLTNDGVEALVKFDWETGRAHGSVDGAALETQIEGLAHDRVSIQYELMQDLLNETPSDHYTMFEVDRLRPVNITIVGKKQVDVPAGKFDVVGVSHQAEGSKRITTLWCSEELGFLPVVIEQHRKGKLKARAVLMEYQPAAGT